MPTSTPRPTKLAIPPAPVFASALPAGAGRGAAASTAGRSVLRIVVASDDQDPTAADSSSASHQPLPVIPRAKLLPLIAVRLNSLPAIGVNGNSNSNSGGTASTAVAGINNSSRTTPSPWVDVRTTGPSSPEFWRVPVPSEKTGAGTGTGTTAAAQTQTGPVVLVTRRLDSGLVNLPTLLLALGAQSLLHGLIICDLVETDLGLSPSGSSSGSISGTPWPATPLIRKKLADASLPIAGVPDAGWVTPAIARRCMEIFRRKRHFANRNRHHRRGKDSPFSGAPFARTPTPTPPNSGATPTSDPDESAEPWTLLGCIVDANVEYMRVWYKEVGTGPDEKGAEANFRMLPEFSTPDLIVQAAKLTDESGQVREEWEAKCSWDILGPLTTPFFLPMFSGGTPPIPLDARNPSASTLLEISTDPSSPDLSSTFTPTPILPTHPFIIDRPSLYPEPVRTLSNLLRRLRELQLELYFAVPTVQRNNVKGACGSDALDPFVAALELGEQGSVEARVAAYLAHLVSLDSPEGVIEGVLRDEEVERTLKREGELVCEFLERAVVIRRGLGKKWEGSVELLAKELAQIKLREENPHLSPAGEGIAVADLAVTGSADTVERAAGFRRWQLKKIGERTAIRTARLVSAYQQSLKTGQPLQTEESSFDRMPSTPGMGLLSPGPELSAFPGIPPELPQKPSQQPPIPEPEPEPETGPSTITLPPLSPSKLTMSTTPTSVDVPPTPTTPLSVRRRLSDLFFGTSSPKPPAASKSVRFGTEEPSPLSPKPTSKPSTPPQPHQQQPQQQHQQQEPTTPPRRKPPPKSEAFSLLLRSLSSPQSLSSSQAAPSPGTLIATAKTPAASEIPKLADEVGGLHAHARGELGMRTPFVELGLGGGGLQEEEMSSATSSSDGDGEEVDKSPVKGRKEEQGRLVGTRVKVERRKGGLIGLDWIGILVTRGGGPAH